MKFFASLTIAMLACLCQAQPARAQYRDYSGYGYDGNFYGSRGSYTGYGAWGYGNYSAQAYWGGRGTRYIYNGRTVGTQNNLNPYSTTFRSPTGSYLGSIHNQHPRGR